MQNTTRRLTRMKRDASASLPHKARMIVTIYTHKSERNCRGVSLRSTAAVFLCAVLILAFRMHLARMADSVAGVSSGARVFGRKSKPQRDDRRSIVLISAQDALPLNITGFLDKAVSHARKHWWFHHPLNITAKKQFTPHLHCLNGCASAPPPPRSRGSVPCTQHRKYPLPAC